MTPITYTLTYAATGTAQTKAVYVSEDGFAPVVAVATSALAGGKSVTVAVKDSNDNDVFGSGALAGGTVHYFGRIGDVSAGVVPVHPTFTLVGTLSEAWGGTGGTIEVTFYVDCNRGA